VSPLVLPLVRGAPVPPLLRGVRGQYFSDKKNIVG